MPLAQTATPEPEVKRALRDLNPIGGGPRIRLDRAALIGLELHIREGVRAINGRGVEIGGLILGNGINWGGTEVIITGFTPVEIEYRFGPAFRPSEADVSLFKEAAAKEGGKVIGYFRSQLRDGFPVREEDSRLLGLLFPTSDSCFISVHASANTPSNADLYQVRPGTPPELLQLFALKEREPTAAKSEKPPALAVPRPAPEAGRPEAVPVAGPGVAPEAAAGSTPQVPPEPATEAAPNRSGLLWTVGGIAAALSIATVAYTVGQRSNPASNPPPVQAARSVTSLSGDPKIGLHVVEQGAQVEIRWNSLDPAISTATRGVLIITDGAGPGGGDSATRAPGDINLTGKQLHSGLYLYKPATNNLTVLLMIYQPDGSFNGDLKEFTGTHPAPAPPPNFTELPTPPPPPVRAQTATPLATPSTAHESPKVAVEKVAFENVQAKTARRWSVQRPVVLPKASAAPAVLEPPTAAVRPPAVSGPQIPMLGLSSLPAAPPSGAPPSATPASPAPSMTYHAGPSQLVAPQIVHQAVPAVPLGVASKIRTEVQLEVMVAVDTDGRVSGARIVSSRGSAAGLLTIETLKAAQLCRFAPAQQDGHSVPSSTVLTFRFAPRPN